MTIPYSSEKSGENSQSRLDASSVHSLLEAETAYFIPFHFFLMLRVGELFSSGLVLSKVGRVL